MRHLVIAAHPSMRSFNHAVVEAYTSELIERGHRVECRDLYGAGFNPILSARDLAAVARGKLAKDIKVEQAAIRRADVLTFISPLWWSGFPAMLKGYLDRVFCAGFAYVIKGGDYLPGLSGKKGAIITTSGATAEELKSGGTLRARRCCSTHPECLQAADFRGVSSPCGSGRRRRRMSRCVLMRSVTPSSDGRADGAKNCCPPITVDCFNSFRGGVDIECKCEII